MRSWVFFSTHKLFDHPIKVDSCIFFEHEGRKWSLQLYLTGFQPPITALFPLGHVFAAVLCFLFFLSRKLRRRKSHQSLWQGILDGFLLPLRSVMFGGICHELESKNDIVFVVHRSNYRIFSLGLLIWNVRMRKISLLDFTEAELSKQWLVW